MSPVKHTITLLAVMLSAPALAVDPNKAIDFRADRLRVEGGKKSMALVGAKYVQQTTVNEGETIGLVCDWSANLVGGVGYWKTKIAQKLQVVIQRNGKTHGFMTVVVPAGTELGTKKTKTSGWHVPSPENPLPYQFSSTTKNFGRAYTGSTDVSKWTADEPGEHEFTCVIPETDFEEPTLENNVATAIVVVVPGPSKMLRSPSREAGSADQHTPRVSSPNPGGTAKPGTDVAVIKAPVISKSAPAPALADLLSEATVTVGTKPVAWGGIVAVSAAESRIVRNGMCEFAVRHVVRNAGAGAAGAFHRRWTNSNVAGNWDDSYPPIPAGGAVERVDTLPLKPGRNVLYLRLDPNDAVAESDENNNLNRIAIDLSGECGAPVSESAGQAGGRLKLPKY